MSVEDVIGEYVQLKRSGRNFKGLSPFNNEKTPSFMVSPEKQIWHDFSSGKGGNVFSFVMEMEGLDFKGALEVLARKAGIDLSEYQNSRSASLSKEKERLYEVLELATKFYQVQFTKSKSTLEYVLKTRGYSKKTALDFRLGYSPNTGDALSKYLKTKGVSEADIKRAGLGSARMRGFGDMFRGRLMVPLSDQQGRVIGFTARQLDDDPNAPKYINTPQTIIYDKSRNVFGLHMAKDAIRKAGYSVLVEGNLDVIASHQAGVTNVVATAGTAMTEMQLKALQRFAGEVRLAFDQDRAGLSAAERSIPIASKVGVTITMISIPSGKDPDELIKKDPKLWVQAIEKSQPALDWLIDRYEDQLDLTTATGKSQFSDIVLSVIKRLDDSVEQEHYIEKVAGIIGVSKDALISKLSREPSSSKIVKKRTLNIVQGNSADMDHVKTQNQLLALCLMKPNLRTYLTFITDEMLATSDGKELLNFLLTNLDFDGDPTKLKELKNIIDYVRMLALQYETLYQDLDHVELTYEAQRLQVRLVERYVKANKNELSEILKTSNDNQTQTMLEKAKKLDELLKKAKENINEKKVAN